MNTDPTQSLHSLQVLQAAGNTLDLSDEDTYFQLIHWAPELTSESSLLLFETSQLHALKPQERLDTQMARSEEEMTSIASASGTESLYFSPNPTALTVNDKNFAGKCLPKVTNLPNQLLNS